MLTLQLGAELLRAFGRLWAPPPAPGDGAEGGSQRRQELRRALWRLRRAYATAAGDGALEELVRLVRGLASRSGDLRSTVVAWIDVVEILVQDVEERQGSRRRRGAQKKQEVQSALVHLLAGFSTQGGRVPYLFEPFLYEIVADASIDAVVLLLNRHALWQAPTAGGGGPGLRKRLGAAIGRPFQPLRTWLSRRIRRHVLARNPISPALAARLQEAGASTSLGAMLAGSLELVDWVGRHRDQVVASVEIVALTVREAEAFLELAGGEKKAYARDLILAFLQEEGLAPAPGSWAASLVEALIDAFIDAVVYLFHKRELFRHRAS